MAATNVLKVKYLSIKQVGQILDVSERTVRRRLDEGCFVAIQEGGRYRILQSSLEKYMHSLLEEAGVRV